MNNACTSCKYNLLCYVHSAAYDITRCIKCDGYFTCDPVYKTSFGGGVQSMPRVAVHAGCPWLLSRLDSINQQHARQKEHHRHKLAVTRSNIHKVTIVRSCLFIDVRAYMCDGCAERETDVLYKELRDRQCQER